jgi:hypothetical protein
MSALLYFALPLTVFLLSNIGGTANGIYLFVGDHGSPTGGGLDFINGQAFLERFYSVYDTTNRRASGFVNDFPWRSTNALFADRACYDAPHQGHNQLDMLMFVTDGEFVVYVFQMDLVMLDIMNRWSRDAVLDLLVGCAPT